MRNVFLLSALVAAIPLSSHALTPAQTKTIRRAILTAPVPELPAKAVELVNAAAPADQKDTALAALRAAIYRQRSVAPQLVAALTKALPDAAGAIAKTATEVDSNQAGEIAHAAMAAAPAARTEVISSVNSAYYSPANGAASVSTYTPSSSFSQSVFIDNSSAADTLSTRGSGGGVPTGNVHNDKNPINPGPDPSHHPFHGPPPWSAGPGHAVDYANPHRPF